ncbi:permease-like cell division protein FtsX [Caldalkalibacillus salinus]|uniref:permease-like cell division protein FtsX n=1 Tax=Caldalkalibacillus salinus TaxID=2803787 RepID=UPI0019246DFA|nr:permease-like cell division protein FtsX [Caldalkalibacillus salinus]
MKISTLGRHVKEGVKNIGRNGWMTFASVLSVAITLFILGVFLLLAMNINNFTEELEDQVEISAYVELTTDEEDINRIEKDLEEIQGVDTIEYVPKEEGIDNFIDGLGEQGRFFEGFRDEENNPLPDKFIIKAEFPQQTERIARRVQEVEDVYNVEYGAGIIDRLFSITNNLRNIGVAFIIGLAFTAMFLIANTIKVTIYARQTEIEIMKLVGATNGFIRWPFFIEGLLLGVIGAVIPIILLGFGYYHVLETYGDLLSYNLFNLLPLFPLVYQMAVLLLGIGAFIGMWGSIASVRRFLKV